MGKVAFGLACGVAVAWCAVATVLVGRRIRRRMKWWRLVRVVKDFEHGCEATVWTLRQVASAMTVEMRAGLATHSGSKLEMLVTFVDKLPNGSEKGTYYALDLLDTNFRVSRVQLGGTRSSTLVCDVYQQPIPQNVVTGTSEDLFDFIASSLKEFVERERDVPEHSLDITRELGFTFSFPVKQTSVSSGTLLKWTKGFVIKDMVGREIAECLEKATTKKGLKMRVAALVNDSVGTLALGHYHDIDVVGAVILARGTNACYLERTDAIIKFPELLASSSDMVINIEWGNFYSIYLPRTVHDKELDADSPNPNNQVFEKLISGMYLGDIVRRVILRMSRESDTFEAISSKLSVPFILRTEMIATMHEDGSDDLTEVESILRDVLEIPDVPLKVRRLIVKVCDVVTRRAARLAAAGIVGILKKIGRDGTDGITDRCRDYHEMRKTVVAIDGSLYTDYTMFREYMDEALTEILGEDVAQHVILKVIEDGSAIGAALVAASHSSYRVDSVQL